MSEERFILDVIEEASAKRRADRRRFMRMAAGAGAVGGLAMLGACNNDDEVIVIPTPTPTPSPTGSVTDADVLTSRSSSNIWKRNSTAMPPSVPACPRRCSAARARKDRSRSTPARPMAPVSRARSSSRTRSSRNMRAKSPMTRSRTSPSCAMRWAVRRWRSRRSTCRAMPMAPSRRRRVRRV